MLDYKGTGMSVMEMSHRSKAYQEIIDEAEADLRELMKIPDNYKVLFLQGGASQQFAMIPMNLMKNGVADYIITGQWAKKAYQEAQKYGTANAVASSADKGFSYIPYQYRKYITNIRDYYHTANQFNCGAKDMFVRTSYEVSAEGFATTAAHEVGHSLSGSWGWVCSSSRYTHAINSDINKVSGYGSKNNSEDFAEFVQFAVSCSG